MSWKIYHKDGSVLTDVNDKQITVHGLEYSDKWMEECFVTIDFKHEAPINFAIGDYLIYRNGERFELNYDPGKQKQARVNTYGEGFVYEGVKFNSLQDELARTDFIDVVLNDNQLHYTSLPKFSFYVETIDDLLDRIQANLDEQIGKGMWKIFSRSLKRSMQRGITEEEWKAVYGDEETDTGDFDSQSITVDSQTCWQALALSNSKWDINFVVRNRNVYVGTAGKLTKGIFKYGLGKGLYEIEQNADSDQSIITRLRAYGSEKNLPSHYYADLGSTPFLNVTGDYHTGSTDIGLSVMLEDSEYDGMWTNVKSDNGTVKHVLVSCEIDGYKFDAELELVKVQTPSCTTRLLIDGNKTASDAVKAKIDAGVKQILFLSGAKVTKFNSNRINYIKNLPNNMSISRLMLPGFPTMSLKEFWDSLTDEEKKYVNPSGREHIFSTDKYRPYLDSVNIEKIGLRSGSQFFDTDDKTNGVIEIYPTIEEMEIGGVRIDEIYKGSEIDDNGRFDDGETSNIKNFDIYLNPVIDFDINDLRDDDFSISMKDGMCGGRSFKVASATKIEGMWRLSLERVKDDALALYFPYKDYPIKKGDHFMLTGIELPESYIKAAALKLLKYAIALLDKNDYTRYVYQPKVDEIFMARQHDEAMADKTGTIVSYHDTLKAGDIMQFEDKDLGIDAQITIDQLTIKEEDGSIPTYEITLREDKEVGTVEKIQQQISSLSSGNGGSGGGGATMSQVKSVVASEGEKYFLSKLKDDTAQGTITFEKVQKFLKGMKVGANGEYGVDENGNGTLKDVVLDRVHDARSTEDERVIVGAQGFDMYMGDDGKSHLYIDDLIVRNRAFFPQLDIRKVSYSGGQLLMGPAGSTIAKVVYVFDDEGNVLAYKCYAKADDGTTATTNYWRPGMMALCQTFNVKDGVYENSENRYYWRLCVDAGQELLSDGKMYSFFTLSNVASFGGGDEVIPDSREQLLGDGKGNVLQFDGVLLSIVNNENRVSLADVLGRESITADDAGLDVKDRRFFGYDPMSNAVPMEGDVVVAVGDEVRWKSLGNVIKIATSTEDNATDNAPSITMYHGIGAPRAVSATSSETSVWQWKVATVIISPVDVRFNSKNFKFFTYTDAGDMVDVDAVYEGYEIVSSYSSMVRKADMSCTPLPGDVTFLLQHRMGNNIEIVDRNSYVLEARWNGTIPAHNDVSSLADVQDALTASREFKMLAVSALMDGKEVARLDFPIMDDGQQGVKGPKGDDGTSVSIQGSALAHCYDFNVLDDALLTGVVSSPSVGSVYLLDKASNVIGANGWKGDGAYDHPCTATCTSVDNKTFRIDAVDNGVGYLIDGELWVKSEDAWNNAGSIQGPQGEKGDKGDTGEKGKDALTISFSPKTVLYNTDSNGQITGSEAKDITISAARGSTSVDASEIKVNLVNGVNCSASIKSNNTFSITSLRKNTVTLPDGSEVKIPANSGYVGCFVTVQNKITIVSVPFAVNMNAFFGSVVSDNKKFEANFANLKNDLEKGESTFIDYGNLQVTAARNIFANYSGIIDSSGKVKNEKGAGLVTTSDYAELFAEAYNNDDKGVVKASMKTFVTKDDNGYISNASITADNIVLEGHSLDFKGNEISITSDNFVLDKEGNIKMNGSLKSEYLDVESGEDLSRSDNYFVKSKYWVNTFSLKWDSSQIGRTIRIANYTSNAVQLKADDTHFFIVDGIKSIYFSIMPMSCAVLHGLGHNDEFIAWCVERQYYYDAPVPQTSMKYIARGLVVPHEVSGKLVAVMQSQYCVGGGYVSCERLDAGLYRLVLPKNISTCYAKRTPLPLYRIGVLLQGYGYSLDDPNKCAPIKATVKDIYWVNSDTMENIYIDVWTSDDASVNDGAFSYIIYNMDNSLEI